MDAIPEIDRIDDFFLPACLRNVAFKERYRLCVIFYCTLDRKNFTVVDVETGFWGCGKEISSFITQIQNVHDFILKTRNMVFDTNTIFYRYFDL